MRIRVKKLKEVLLKLPFTIFEIGKQRYIIAMLPNEVEVVEAEIPMVEIPLKTVSDLYFNLGKDVVEVLFTDIICFETNRPYVRVVMKNRCAVNICTSIKALMLLLPAYLFFEIKNDCIVGRHYIISIDGGRTGHVNLKHYIPKLISNDKKSGLKRWKKLNCSD